MLLLVTDKLLLAVILNLRILVPTIQTGPCTLTVHHFLISLPILALMNLAQETLLWNVGSTVWPLTLAHKHQV